MNREDFPMLKDNLIYFDNGATTFKPNLVKNAIDDYYENYTANAHRGDYKNSLKVDLIFDDTREKVRKLINAKEKSEIVFTSGATESLNMIVNGYFKYKLQKDDEVLITKSEHASNILPWFILQKELGIKVKYIELDNNKVTIETLKKAINNKTKVISIAHITNVIGDERPIKEISKIAHENNILLVVDAAQSIAHSKVDVVDMDIDFLAFSGHKMYGPTGIGVMYAKYDLLNEMNPMYYGGGMNATFTENGYIELREVPTRLEAGTPNVEGVIGLRMAIEYITNIGIDKISKHEKELKRYLLQRLKEIDNIEIYNKNEGNVLAFNIKDIFPQDTAIYLDKHNICVRAGNHCAKILNNVFNVNNTCRISFGIYNTKQEIDKFIEILKNIDNIWNEII